MFSSELSGSSFGVSGFGVQDALPGSGQRSRHGDAGSFFFPGQFAARPAVTCLADLASALGVATDATQLAQIAGIDLQARLGIQDLIGAAERLGLKAYLERHPPAALAQLALPVLVFLSDGTQGMQVVTHSDGRYVVMHNHSSVISTNSMVPLANLSGGWTQGGQGWLLRLERCLSDVV